MDTDTRVDGYLRQRHTTRLTPAQVRRSNHKLRRANWHGDHLHVPGEVCAICRPAPKRQITTATRPQRLIFPRGVGRSLANLVKPPV